MYCFSSWVNSLILEVVIEARIAGAAKKLGGNARKVKNFQAHDLIFDSGVRVGQNQVHLLSYYRFSYA